MCGILFLRKVKSGSAARDVILPSRLSRKKSACASGEEEVVVGELGNGTRLRHGRRLSKCSCMVGYIMLMYAVDVRRANSEQFQTCWEARTSPFRYKLKLHI